MSRWFRVFMVEAKRVLNTRGTALVFTDPVKTAVFMSVLYEVFSLDHTPSLGQALNRPWARCTDAT